MQAVIKESPSPGIRVGEVPEPVHKEGSVIVSVKTTGICGSDLHAYEWDPQYEWLAPYLPTVLGHEITGYIENTPAGNGVAKGQLAAVRPGIECGECPACLRGASHLCPDRIRLGFELRGGLAPLVSAPARNLYPLPATVDEETASLVEPLTVATHATKCAQVRPGATTAVIGVGAIGLLSAQALSAFGAGKVLLVGTESDEQGGGLAIGESFGTYSLVSGSSDLADWRESCEAVVVAAGAPQAVSTALELVGARGTVVIVGLGIGNFNANADRWVRREISVVGAFGTNSADWLDAQGLIESGQVQGRGIVSHHYSLVESPQAFEALAQRQARKILIHPNE